MAVIADHCLSTANTPILKDFSPPEKLFYAIPARTTGGQWKISFWWQPFQWSCAAFDSVGIPPTELLSYQELKI